MLRTIGILAAFYCLAILCSCQKDVDTNTPPITDTTPSGEGYMPLTAGTYWVYKDSASNGYDTATVLEEDTIINGITLTKVHTVSATKDNNGYYGIKDHNYYFTAEESGITVTMLVLNDTMSVGNTWVYDIGTINNVPARSTGTIVEKMDNFTVQGKSYSNVIHTRNVIAINLGGTYTDFATYDFYFAQGKGIIRVKSTVADFTGSGVDLTNTQDLIDYSIK